MGTISRRSRVSNSQIDLRKAFSQFRLFSNSTQCLPIYGSLMNRFIFPVHKPAFADKTSFPRICGLNRRWLRSGSHFLRGWLSISQIPASCLLEPCICTRSFQPNNWSGPACICARWGYYSWGRRRWRYYSCTESIQIYTRLILVARVVDTRV